MLPSIRSQVLRLVTAAPQPPVAAPPPKAPKPKPAGRPAQQADQFERRAGPPPSTLQRDFSDALSQLAVDKPGSTVVAFKLHELVQGAMLNPRLTPAEREQAVLKYLKTMLQAGRGPAFQAITDFLQVSKQLGVPLTDETRKAVATALTTLEAGCLSAAQTTAATLHEHAPIDVNALRDVAQLGWLLTRGSEAQRTSATLRFLAAPAGTPLGDLAEQVRAVVFEGASKLVTFSAKDQAAAKALIKEWPHASPQRRAELQATHGALINALERACGGLTSGASPQYLEEQRQRGNPLPSWVGDGRAASLSDDLALIEAIRRVLGAQNQVVTQEVSR